MYSANLGFVIVIVLATAHAQLNTDDGMGHGVLRCLRIIANETDLTEPTDGTLEKNFTQNVFKSVCRAKDRFVQCIDENLNSSDDEVTSLFKPLFDKTAVSDAYTGLCDNLTMIEDSEDLTCLMNTTGMMPCYEQFNTYIGYLSVVMRFGSKERQLSDSVTRTLVCTLSQKRTECEVNVLKGCSAKVGEIMAAFYENSLPGACRTDKGDN